MPDSLQPRPCRIIVDAMGGDYAPKNAVLGAVEAQNTLSDAEVFLVGKRSKIESVLSDTNCQFSSERIIDADQVIEMCEVPTVAVRTKKDSSIVVGCTKVKDKFADAFVSAGNTGAMMTASTLIMGRLPGVGRPTIGTFFPNMSGVCTLFDVGASVDSKAVHLVEYAIMGSIFVSEIAGIPNPTVGLLNVGEEEAKGNEVCQQAYALLKKAPVNFIGNVEGKDILKGSANIIVCDGFVGNIILKFAESILPFLKHVLTEYSKQSLKKKIRTGLAKGTLKDALQLMDYQTYGGVPLLGVNGISIIGHGSSSVLAMKNMVIRAKEMHDHNILKKITDLIITFDTSIKGYNE